MTVIDGVTNWGIGSIGVGSGPRAFAYNPVQNRVYVANYGSSSISVLRDSMPNGVEESPKPQAPSLKPAATVVRGLPAGAVAFDAMGRRVVNPRPGVYFVRSEPSAAGREPSAFAVRKVILQR